MTGVLWYRPGDFARMLGVDRTTVYAMMDGGHLRFLVPPGFKRGRRIPAEELDRLRSLAKDIARG